MLCAVGWSSDMLVSFMTDCLTVVKASLALEETTLFLRVTWFLEFMSITNTGKILFFSFILSENCLVPSSLATVATNIYFNFFELYKHTKNLAECAAGSLSQSYSLLDFHSVYCWFELSQQKMSNAIDGVSHHTIHQLPQNFKNAFRLFPTALLAFAVHVLTVKTLVSQLIYLFTAWKISH